MWAAGLVLVTFSVFNIFASPGPNSNIPKQLENFNRERC